jgi:acyl-coenzyme A synthetase/AMP-(fatty) acid ligase
MSEAMAPLSRALGTTRPPTQAVAYRDGVAIAWSDFCARVAGIAARLAPTPQHGWALCSADPYEFACGFFGLLHSGKRVVIPSNFLPGTLASLNDVDGWLAQTDVEVPAGAAVMFSDVEPLAAPPPPASEDAIVDLFTSGTTGVPKRIRKRVRQLSAEIAVLEQQWGERLAAAPVVGTVPHYHIYGLLFRLLWPVCAGRGFDTHTCSGPDELLPRMRRFNGATIVSSPAQLTRLPELMELEMLLPYTRLIFSSGGPLPAKTAAAYAARLGTAPTEVYGSSETGGVAWRVQTDAADGDLWKPLPDIQVREGPEGALQVRSAFVDASAWLETSDAADIGADGRFRLRGRRDRVVKIEEKRLSLPELEDRLRSHPWVRDAGVVMLELPRALLGAVVTLTAEGREQLHAAGKRATSVALRRFLEQYYERPLLPRRWRFPDAMPQNDRGKVAAAALVELLAQATP